MNDYIRKAVELADTVAPWDFYQQNKDTIPCSTVELDALAAQLTRQVDDSGGNWVCVEPTLTSIYDGGTGRDLPPASGPDRTMNTIIAIVDSGVLS